MLERATACLKSGAARDSLRCTSKAPRSKRMLHSTFWNHGAGALDLPPWAVSMLPMPSNLPLRHDSDESSGTRSREQAQRAVATEGVFLDFLYPPQALAWLQRASAQQQLQKWEKRNIRRLPEGFVVASRGSRGYASRSHLRREGAGVGIPAQHEQTRTTKDVYQLFRPHARGSRDRQMSRGEGVNKIKESTWSHEYAHRHQGHAVEEHDGAFAISPGELAESTPNMLTSLRNLLMLNRGTSITENPDTERRLIDRAWTMFQSLDDDTRMDIRLRRELLDWFALHQDEHAASHCEELFRSIPTGEKTAEMYNAMMLAYLRSKKLSSASNLHHEALQTLENGYVISKQLFEHAIAHNNWQLAIQTASQHRNRYNELGQLNQVQLFWLRVSDMPQLPEKAMLLFNYLEGQAGLRTADSDTRHFCSRFLFEALSQLLVGIGEGNDSQWWKSLHRPQIQDSFIDIVQFLVDTESVSAKSLEDALFAFLNRNKAEYPDHHHMVSYLYWELRKLVTVEPSERLLSVLLWRLSHYETTRHQNRASALSVTTQDIIRDWKWFYGKPSKEAYTRLVASSAWAGRADEHHFWMRDFRSMYPSYEDWKASLWTTIYLYAKRTNLDNAQQAFAEVKRITAEHGDEPDLRCWSVLLHAHGRADDLDGALTNFQNMIESSNVKPNEDCFGPIFIMLASRGDVEGIEDFMDQFDEIVGERRSTLTLMSLMNAYIHQGSVQEAETLLRDAIPKVRGGEIHGTMTPCFNSLMRAYARRHDIDGVMKTYHWMKKEEVDMDADSFAAIIMVLCNYQRTDDAYRILRSGMRESRVQPTAFHYTIMMRRELTNRNYTAAISLYNEMIEHNIRPSKPSNTLYLRAKTLLENDEKSFNANANDDSDSIPLETSMKELEEMLQRYDGEELAVRQSASLVGFHDNTAADPGTYFETLIAVHGKRRCFDAVKSLFASYTEVAKGRGGDESKLPLGIICQLMSAHWHAGEYDQVEEYWKLAKERADEVAPPVPVPSFRYLVSKKSLRSADVFKLYPSPEPYPGPGSDDPSGSETSPLNQEEGKPESKVDDHNGSGIPPLEKPSQTLLTEKDTPMTLRPSPRRRHILNQPLRWYLAALNSQSRVMDSIATVSRLLTQGYTMDKSTWNTFICHLLETSPPLALVAFVLTDRFLTPNFPGWVHQRKTKYPVKSEARRAGLQYINARYVEPTRLMPQYKTLVRLAAALLDIRRLESQGRRGMNTDVPPDLRKFIGTTREIRKLAARTLHVVQSIPYIVGDPMQAKYLRREMD